jgi:hypothetical protein
MEIGDLISVHPIWHARPKTRLSRNANGKPASSTRFKRGTRQTDKFEREKQIGFRKCAMPRAELTSSKLVSSISLSTRAPTAAADAPCGRRIDLVRDCELLELLQYECLVVQPEMRDSPIQCWPIQRLFRR